MAVFRIEHCTDYTVIGNKLLRDNNLSEKALGLFVRILSLPANWNFSITGLSNICKGGYDSVESSLNELEENGYLVRSKIRDDKGRYDTEFVFYEEPIVEKPSVIVHSGKTTVDNPQQYNKDISSKDILNKDINYKETTKVVKKELDFTKEVQNEECCKRDVLFYWIDHLDKGQEFRDALHYWLTTYKKTVSIKQMTNKLNRLYNLYTDERDQTECILQSADNGWQGFFPIKDKKVYQNNDFSNGQKNGRIRTIDTSAQEDQLEALAKVFGRNGG